MDGFDRSLAFLVAIEDYDHGIPKLKTPVADATALAAVLRTLHGFQTEIVTDKAGRKLELEDFLDKLQWRVGPDDRVLFYFAGHGIALGVNGEPQGFILPQDARKDADAKDSFIAMQDLHERLALLPCRHLLVILDCCFAGAFRWSGSRAIAVVAESLHRERYRWFIEDPAWQVIASAAHDQEAIDVAARQPLGSREIAGDHSPFALALIDGLTGNADRTAVGGRGDGIITATELFQHVEDAMRVRGEAHLRQTPILWLLKKHDKGQFVFLVPGRSPDELPPGPELNEQANPWRGLESYEEKHSDFFFGRNAASERLAQRFLGTEQSERGAAHAPERFLVVTGPSGVGKSSLVKAGMLPRLPKDRMRSIVLRPSRPGPDAFASLAAALREAGAGDAPAPSEQELRRDSGSLADWIKKQLDARDLVLVVDQLEEVVTSGTDTNLPYEFMNLIETTLARTGSEFRVVFTVRPEYEPHFVQSAMKRRWAKARFLVPQMMQDELRRVIEGPAARQTMRFESDRLVDALVNDVVNMPGALPLLSFALSQMYHNYLARRRDGTDRVLSEADYILLLDDDDRSQATTNLRGGVTGALRLRANQIIQEGDQEYRMTARRVLERLVSIESGEFARRRTPGWEFEIDDATEQARVKKLLDRLVNERLVVIDSGRDSSSSGPNGQETPAKAETQSSYELAHDALIHIWRELSDWVRGDSVLIADLRTLTTDAIEWNRRARTGPVWDDRVEIAKIAALRSAPSPGLNRIELAFAKASQKRSARNRAVFWIAAIVLVATTVGAVWSAYLAIGNSVESQRQADIAQSQRLSTLGRASLSNDPRSSVLFAAHAVKRAAERPERELPQWAHALWSLIHSDQRGDGFLPEAEQVLREALAKQGGKTFCCQESEISNVAVSRDGNWIATADDNHRVRLWKEKDPVPSRSAPTWLNSEGAVLELGFSEGDRWVVAAGEKGVWLWPPSTDSNEPLRIATTADLTKAALSPSGQWLVIASGDALELWDLGLTAPEVTRKAFSMAKTFRSVSFDANEDLLAIELEGRLELWRIGEVPAEIALRQGEMGKDASYLDSIRLSQDGRWLVATIYNGSAYLWDLSTVDADPRFLPHPRPAKIRGQEPYRVGALAFSADGKWLATASSDHSARLWPLGPAGDRKPITLLVGYDDNDDEYTPTTTSLAISPDSRWVAVTGSELDDTYVWDLQSDKFSEDDATTLPNGDEVQMDAAGRWLAITYTGNLSLWPLSTIGPSPNSMLPTRFTGQKAKFSADSAIMVTALYEKAYSWRLNEVGLSGLVASPEQIVAEGPKITERSNALVSPARRWLVAADSANIVRLFDLASDTMSDVELDGGLRQLAGYPPVAEIRPLVNAAAFDPTESKLAIATELAVEVWNVSGDRVRLEARFPLPSSAAGSYPRLAISPDGHRLALAQRKQAWLWNLDPTAQRDAPIELSAHREGIEYLAFSSDSRTLVTQARMWGSRGYWQAGQGMEVFLWNVAKPTSPSQLSLAAAEIESFKPDPGGRWIFTASPDGGWLWDLQGAVAAPPGQRLAVSRGEAVHVMFAGSRGLLITGRENSEAADVAGARLWTIGGSRSEARTLELSGYLGRRDDIGQDRLSPDGRFLVTSGPAGKLYVWDLDNVSSPMSPKRLEWPGNFVDGVSFSSNSKRFAARDGNRLEVFDLSSEEPGRFFSISSSAYAMRLEALGNMLLTSDGKVWRLDSAVPALSAVTFPNVGLLDNAVFTPNSHWLLNMTWGVARSPLKTAQLIEAAKGVVGRNFTRREWDEHSPDTPYEKTFDDLP